MKKKQLYIPQGPQKPLRLALSLLFSKNPAARSALYFAIGGLAMAPLDLLLKPFENSFVHRYDRPKLPIFLVAGPPRSGTSLVAQYLVNVFDVSYLNNLTSLFPRSPLTINRIWGRNSISNTGDYDAFYGRSKNFSGFNDALYIWDRWLGRNRSEVPNVLAHGSEFDMPSFFAALEALYSKPIVGKVNRLNVCASIVAPYLPTAKFLFVKRDPLFLAQSLLVARERIVGNMSLPYGVNHSDADPSDPVTDVCRQVKFHFDSMRREANAIPPDNILWVQYEDFCANPVKVAEKIKSETTELGYRKNINSQPTSFNISDKRTLSAQTFERLQKLIEDMKIEY